VQAGQIFYFVEYIWSYAQIIFPAGFASQGGLDIDPSVWLDGAKPPQKLSIIKS
jgi:hypothetical protein